MSVELRAFETETHRPFLWRAHKGTKSGPESGQAAHTSQTIDGNDGAYNGKHAVHHEYTRAALMVHGFPGTPSELRRAGRLLHGEGWTVQGLLLPGFGHSIAELPQRRHADWVGAIEHALAELRKEHQQVILVGNSMGAALTLHVAARHPVDGLVLFAPFWRVDSWLDKIYPVAAPLLPQIKPFVRANFSDPKFRATLHQFMPEANLDDDAVQQAIRELRIPIHVLGQVRRSGQLGFHAAAKVQAPTLIIQGAHDPLVKPTVTRRLAANLPHLYEYVEIPGDHEIISANDEAWPQAAAAVRRFAHWLTSFPMRRTGDVTPPETAAPARSPQ